MPTLSPRETEVLALLTSTGGTDKALANTLHCAESTITQHLRNIRGKLNIPTRTQLILWAIRQKEQYSV